MIIPNTVDEKNISTFLEQKGKNDLKIAYYIFFLIA